MGLKCKSANDHVLIRVSSGFLVYHHTQKKSENVSASSILLLVFPTLVHTHSPLSHCPLPTLLPGSSQHMAFPALKQ